MGTKTSNHFVSPPPQNERLPDRHGSSPTKSPANTYLSDHVLESVLGELAEAKTTLNGARLGPKKSTEQIGEAVKTAYKGNNQRSLNQLLGQLEEAVGIQFGTKKALSPAPKPDTTPRSRFLIFQVDQWRLAIPLDQVMEVGDTPPTTWVPNLPSWIRGITHLRGEIYTVVDARHIFQLGKAPTPSKEQRILTRTRADEMRAILMVDRVLGIRNLKVPEWAESKPTLSPTIDPFIRGISEWENRALIFLDLDQFLNSPKLHPWRETAAVS